MADRQLYESLADILSYPDANIGTHVKFIVDYSEGTEGADASTIEEFRTFVKANRFQDVEELFTKTFDMNPTCCLEIGWHKFGEDYQRGEFLVNMRQALEEEGIPEKTELPDHLSYCLRLLPRLDLEDEMAFARDYLQPAIVKIIDGLEDDNPYACVISYLTQTLEAAYGPAVPEEENTDSRLIDLPVLNDSLHYNNIEDLVDGNGKVR